MNRFTPVKKNEIKQKIVEHYNDSLLGMGENIGSSSSNNNNISIFGIGENNGPSSSILNIAEIIGSSSSEMKENLTNSGPSGSKSGPSPSGLFTSELLSKSGSSASKSGPSPSGLFTSELLSKSGSSASKSGPSSTVICNAANAIKLDALDGNSKCIPNASKWTEILTKDFTRFAIDSKCVNKMIPAIRNKLTGGLEYKCT